MKIQVKTNAKVIDRFLLNLHRDQIPFATAGALTSTAFDVRKELVEKTYLASFKLRNRRFPGLVTNVKKARKRDLSATVGNIRGDAKDYLVRHAEGGSKLPQGRHITVPTAGMKRGTSGAIAKGQRPRNLLKSKKAFLLTIRGTPVIAARKGKTHPLEIKYILSPKAVIKKSLPFFQTAEKIVAQRFAPNFSKAFAFATRTGRGRS
jgi:hypothetical protein